MLIKDDVGDDDTDDDNDVGDIIMMKMTMNDDGADGHLVVFENSSMSLNL